MLFVLEEDETRLASSSGMQRSTAGVCERFVVHCEDHQPNDLMVFCPQFYYASVDRTWADCWCFKS